MVEARPVAVALLVGLLSAGCSEFPCVGGASTSSELPSVAFDIDGDSVRYTYWFEDGAQRVVFDRAEIPQTARHSVLVHAPPKTSGELHGAVGWTADVSVDGPATATLRPMALARAQALNAWRGTWRVRWFETRAGLIASEMATRLELEANLANDAGEPPALQDEPDADAGEPPALQDEPEPGAPAAGRQGELPTKVADELANEGISFGNLKRDRVLRVIGARQPLPSDFGLSAAVDLHDVWLFVDEDCGACTSAIDWLDQRDVGHHVMRISDPTNARTLRDLARRAGAKPGVPMLWSGNTLLRGFEVGAWRRHFQTEDAP